MEASAQGNACSRSAIRAHGVPREVSPLPLRRTNVVTHFHASSTHSCAKNGSLTFIFMPISQNSRNILSSPKHSAAITVRAHPARASNARVALIGNVTVFGGEQELAEEEAKGLADCFTKRHPDAKWWLPSRKPGPHLVSVDLFHTPICWWRLSL